jgi:membrane-associated PAP2 superfamily phosphatase
MNPVRPTIWQVVVKSLVTHTVTYFIMGLLASTILDYTRFLAETSLSLFMRPTTDPWVMAGPLFQPVRGILFGIVFYLLREPFFGKKNGWLVMWMVLVVVGIFSTFGPTPGSIEGMLYTVLPLPVHLRGLPEVLLQSLFLSIILFYWVNRPQVKWLSWVMGIAFVILMSFPILGLLVGPAQ